MRLAVILSTYEQPRPLELVLQAYARQNFRDFRIVIADDGSGPATRAVIDRARAETRLELRHVWQPDRGFRKSEILNRAILACDEEYLVFSDGDTIPREDFLETHAALARRGRFLAGGYVKLPQNVSDAITAADVRAGHATDLRWLRAHGYRAGRHALRFTRNPRWAALLDRITSRKVRWVGNNASTWREHIVAVNGFDMDMGYGGQDAALGDRLENLGVRPLRIRYRALAVHLEHERPWRDPGMMRSIAAERMRVRRSGITRAARGLEEVTGEVSAFPS